MRNKSKESYVNNGRLAKKERYEKVVLKVLICVLIVVAFINTRPIAQAATLTIFDGDSYDFSTKTYSDFPGTGDFWYFLKNSTWRGFVANYVGQNGLQDLGDIGTITIHEVTPPSSGYIRFDPVPAVIGHTYVSLAQDGEEGYYIIFKVISIVEDVSVTIDYVYRKANTIFTAASLTVTPSSVASGDQIRFTADINPDPPSSYSYTSCTFEVTRPEGTTITLGPCTSLQSGVVTYDYTPDQIGMYQVMFYVPEQTIPDGGDIYTSVVAGPQNFPVTERPVLDHFEFDTIGNPKIKSETFLVRITAKDQSGNTYTEYNGEGTLSDAKTGFSKTVQFSGGICDPQVTINTEVQSNQLTITGGGKSGESNTFNVISREDPSVLDHFEFDIIGSPQTVNNIFMVRITAKDQYNDVFTGYSGGGTLSDLTGISTSVNFVNGVSNPEVLIDTPYSGDKITVICDGKSGTSNTFDIQNVGDSPAFPIEYLAIGVAIALIIVLGVIVYKKLLPRHRRPPALARYPQSSSL